MNRCKLFYHNTESGHVVPLRWQYQPVLDLELGAWSLGLRVGLLQIIVRDRAM